MKKIIANILFAFYIICVLLGIFVFVESMIHASDPFTPAHYTLLTRWFWHLTIGANV